MDTVDDDERREDDDEEEEEPVTPDSEKRALVTDSLSFSGSLFTSGSGSLPSSSGMMSPGSEERRERREEVVWVERRWKPRGACLRMSIESASVTSTGGGPIFGIMRSPPKRGSPPPRSGDERVGTPPLAAGGGDAGAPLGTITQPV